MPAVKAALYRICKLAQDPSMSMCYLFDPGHTSLEGQTNHVRGGVRDRAMSFHWGLIPSWGEIYHTGLERRLWFTIQGFPRNVNDGNY